MNNKNDKIFNNIIDTNLCKNINKDFNKFGVVDFYFICFTH